MFIPSFLASQMYHYAMVIAFKSAISFKPNLDSPKWWFNGDVPWHFSKKVTLNKQIQASELKLVDHAW